MAKEIKQRIVLDGEREYNQAIRDAQRNLKTMRSELKAETAELGANATAQQKAEVKAKSLKNQIAEQEKIVKAYREALEEVREKYGDNEDAVARYEQRLNDARTALANMKNQLDLTGNSFRQIGDGAKKSILETNALADSFGKISEAAGSMATKMEEVFKGAASVVSQTVGAVWDDLMEIAAKSDSWMDLGAFLGASATEVQKWDRAMGTVRGDITTITSMVSRLKYGGKDNLVAEWFGISGEEYTNDLEYIQVVLQRMADLKPEMVANGTWATAMGDIFGAKKVQEIDGILSDWDDILNSLKTFDVDNGGLGLSDEEIQTMGDLVYQVDLLQEKWNAFKQSAEAKIFGKLALDLTGNAQGALDALIAYMDADSEEERQKAIDDLEKNITEFFTKVGEAIGAAGAAMERAAETLQSSDNGWVKLLGDLMEGLGKALQWMADEDNAQKIATFFEILLGVWATAKMASAVTNLLGMANAFRTIHNNKALTSALNNFGQNVNSGGTGTTGPVNTNGPGGTGAPVSTPNLTAQAMTVATETVSQATVANMVVQNMVGGGIGSNPTAPVVSPGNSLGNGLNVPLLVPPQATGLTAGGTGGGLPAGSATPALPAGEGAPIQLSPNEFVIDGQPTITAPDISIGADTIMFDSGIGLAGGYAIGYTIDMMNKGRAERENFEENVNGILDYYKIDMDDPEVAHKVREAIGYDLDGVLVEPMYSVLDELDDEYWQGVIDKIAQIAAEGGADEDASHELYRQEDKPKTLNDYKDDAIDTLWDWTMDLVDLFGSTGHGMGVRGGLPSSWWGNQGGSRGNADENGISGQDLRGFLDVPRGVESAAEKGVKRGISGLRVEIDGQAAGRILAPYVSEQIARDMG